MILLLPLMKAHAVPSFARQTGLSCAECHTVFPELTPFGSAFKLNGYTMIQSTAGQQPRLQEGQFPPLSAMLQISDTYTRKAQPDSQNGDVLFPDQLSIFYAGRISDKLGSFIQATYDGVEDHFSMDNAEVRYANTTKSLSYGVTLNNNPTVQDLWNATPAWGFPFASSSVAPAPAAATQIDETLGQQVAGLGGYGYWNNRLYGELTFYRSAKIGEPSPPSSESENTIDGAAPYWRLAWTKVSGSHSFEVGTYGLVADIFPTGVSGATNRFRDIAVDAQYQYLGSLHMFSLHSTFIHEKQEWDASFPAGNTSNSSDDLKTFKIDGIYYFNRTYGGALGYFNTFGDRDPLLYTPAPIEGSRTGKPNSSGWIAEINYLPWLNTKLTLQYILYREFNGATSNYDGFGRNAKDNSNLYLNLWLVF